MNIELCLSSDKMDDEALQALTRQLCEQLNDGDDLTARLPTRAAAEGSKVRIHSHGISNGVRIHSHLRRAGWPTWGEFRVESRPVACGGGNGGDTLGVLGGVGGVVVAVAGSGAGRG